MAASIFDAIDSNDELLLEQALGQNPSSVNDKTSEGHLPIHLASWNDKPNLLRQLVIAGADMNARGQWGWTPLHYASFYTSPNAADFLVENGADVNVKDNDHRRPLYFTALNRSSGSNTILGCLLHHQATLDLACAVRLGMSEIVQCMLRCDPTLTKTDDNSADLLSDAVWTGQIELVRTLLDFGADVNQSARNPLPLTVAGDFVFRGELMLARLLLERGADPNLRSEVTKLSPFESAQKSGNKAMLDLLSNL
jgi:uncharacterized protein